MDNPLAPPRRSSRTLACSGGFSGGPTHTEMHICVSVPLVAPADKDTLPQATPFAAQGHVSSSFLGGRTMMEDDDMETVFLADEPSTTCNGGGYIRNRRRSTSTNTNTYTESRNDACTVVTPLHSPFERGISLLQDVLGGAAWPVAQHSALRRSPALKSNDANDSVGTVTIAINGVTPQGIDTANQRCPLQVPIDDTEATLTPVTPAGEGESTEVEVEVIHDVPYAVSTASCEGEELLDVYRRRDRSLSTPTLSAWSQYEGTKGISSKVTGNAVPVDAAPLRPVYFHVHGGGWIRGAKGDAFYGSPTMCFHMTKYFDYVCVAPAYQRGAFERCLASLAAALKWVLRGEIRPFGGDPHHIVLSGHSAGAHLVMMLYLRAGELGLSYDDLRCVKGVVTLGGIFSLQAPMEHNPLALRNFIFRHFYRDRAFGHLGDEGVDDASPSVVVARAVLALESDMQQRRSQSTDSDDTSNLRLPHYPLIADRTKGPQDHQRNHGGDQTDRCHGAPLSSWRLPALCCFDVTATATDVKRPSHPLGDRGGRERGATRQAAINGSDGEHVGVGSSRCRREAGEREGTPPSPSSLHRVEFPTSSRSSLQPETVRVDATAMAFRSGQRPPLPPLVAINASWDMGLDADAEVFCKLWDRLASLQRSLTTAVTPLGSTTISTQHGRDDDGSGGGYVPPSHHIVIPATNHSSLCWSLLTANAVHANVSARR